MRRIPVDRFVAIVLFFLIFASALFAQGFVPESDTAARVAAIEQQTADAKSSADNAWMLTSAALVLMMTGPGLALLYGGLVRKKNVLGTMMQRFALMAVVTVLWAVFSFSLSLGSSNGSIGGLPN